MGRQPQEEEEVPGAALEAGLKEKPHSFPPISFKNPCFLKRHSNPPFPSPFPPSRFRIPAPLMVG